MNAILAIRLDGAEGFHFVLRGYVAGAVGEGGGVAEHVVMVVAVVPRGRRVAAPGGILPVREDLTNSCFLEGIYLLRAPGSTNWLLLHQQQVDSIVVAFGFRAIRGRPRQQAAAVIICIRNRVAVPEDVPHQTIVRIVRVDPPCVPDGLGGLIPVWVEIVGCRDTRLRAAGKLVEFVVDVSSDASRAAVEGIHARAVGGEVVIILIPPFAGIRTSVVTILALQADDFVVSD